MVQGQSDTFCESPTARNILLRLSILIFKNQFEVNTKTRQKRRRATIKRRQGTDVTQ